MAAALFLGANAQAQGQGISKFTKGHSHPTECLSFFTDILGGTIPSDECQDNKCECATQGRASLAVSTVMDQFLSGPPPPPPRQSEFGIHSINCTYHPYGSMSLEDVEDKITNEVGDFEVYNQHMDSHVGLKTSDLSTYIDRLDQSGQYPYLSLSYEFNGQSYYSVLVQACKAYFVEILSESASAHDDTLFTKVDEPRYDHDDAFWADSTTELAVVKVSRATTKIDKMVSFYTQTIGGSVQKRGITE